MYFHATRDDLEDTAFITNDEIASFSIEKYTTKESKILQIFYFMNFINSKKNCIFAFQKNIRK